MIQKKAFVPALVGGLVVLSGCGGGSDVSASSAPLSCAAGSHMVSSKAQAADMIPAAAAPLAGSAKLKALRGHVLAATSRASDLGKADESQEIPVTISLSLNNQAGLASELAEIYRPGSPKFHQFLTPDEFKSRYAPSDEQVAQVASYLTAHGLRSVSADRNGFIVHAQGKIGDLNTAFNTEVHQYADEKGRSFRAPSYELQIPEGLPIQGVHGLQNLSVAHTHLSGPSTAPASSRSGSGPGGGYSPSDIRTAYNVPSSLDGSGQTLALYELDGYDGSDITAYEQQFGLPQTPLQNVLVDGAGGGVGGGQAEVTLDIELMIAIAPKASKILVYEGPNSDQGMLDTYAKIANDNIAKSVSTSWGTSEDGVTSSFIQAENAIFMQMAAQGQTIYSAAGDVGADDNGSSLSIDDPSGQPYVVAVGGTTLSTGSGGAYQSETTWNDSGGAGGGGVSSVWTIPAWQQGLATSQNKASSTMRNIPDVALHSDINSGYAIHTGGGWSTWGGTSCAAPLWAAFNALVNQSRATKGMGPVGYVTPLLYALGRSDRFGADFHDISDGSDNGYFPAVSGYDAATGWGSFNAANLIQDLSQDSVAGGGANSCS